MKTLPPSRGEIWLCDLNPVRGHEQAGSRPALIFSDDLFNHGPAGLVIVIPVTSVHRRIPSQLPIPAAEGGLKKPSYLICEALRSIAKERLLRKLGQVSSETMASVEDCIKILLSL